VGQIPVHVRYVKRIFLKKFTIVEKISFQGDSGGPLFCNGAMYAIHVEGKRCDQYAERTVGVYARLNHVEQFIREATENTAHWES
jgi:secreted trypsin-like serine protease